MKEDKNRKFLNSVAERLASETQISRIHMLGNDTDAHYVTTLIEPPFINAGGVEISTLYSDLRHVQVWHPRLYTEFRKYVIDMYGVLDKELELLWVLYCEMYLNTQS
jgi:hypothetical protein